MAEVQAERRPGVDDEGPGVGQARPKTVLNHKHCFSCGRAISASKEFCSDECRGQHVAQLKRKRRQLIVLWVVSMTIIGVVLLIQLRV